MSGSDEASGGSVKPRVSSSRSVSRRAQHPTLTLLGCVIGSINCSNIRMDTTVAKRVCDNGGISYLFVVVSVYNIGCC